MRGVASPCLKLLLCTCLLVPVQFILAQQAVAPAGTFGAPDLPPAPQSPTVNFDGMALAQNDAAIEQSRLRLQTAPPMDVAVDSNGTALADSDPAETEDDSLGAQRILKSQEPVRAFVFTGGVSLVYTSNVALTSRAPRRDIFAIVDAGIAWNPHLAKNLDSNFSLRASVFRYDRTPELDFNNLSFGAGLSYALPKAGGLVAFGRYDFTELWNNAGRQVLMDHALTLGLQKSIALGRAHAVSFGAAGTLGFSDPMESQRHQIAAFLGYHFQLARRLETDFLFRSAVYFQNGGERTEYNQILSWSFRYRFTDWAELNASLTYGLNRSDHAAFDYDLFTGGASAGVTIRF